MSAVTKQEWVEMFRAIGLDEQRMHAWHVEFETRTPEGHQSFLEWLDIPPAEIDDIRLRSRTI